MKHNYKVACFILLWVFFACLIAAIIDTVLLIYYFFFKLVRVIIRRPSRTNIRNTSS